MHPNPAFRERDREAALAAAAAIGLAHICVATPDGPIVAHAPITRHGDEVRFHVARANRIASHLEGARLVLSIVGAEGYVSPNWYNRPGDQVPTWNYFAIEIEGTARAIDEAALLDQLDALAAPFEPRVIPDRPWHRGKANPAVIDRMLGGIRGYALTIEQVRATRKLSQNKSDADRSGVIAGLIASGNVALAQAMASEDRDARHIAERIGKQEDRQPG